MESAERLIIQYNITRHLRCSKKESTFNCRGEIYPAKKKHKGTVHQFFNKVIPNDTISYITFQRHDIMMHCILFQIEV